MRLSNTICTSLAELDAARRGDRRSMACAFTDEGVSPEMELMHSGDVQSQKLLLCRLFFVPIATMATTNGDSYTSSKSVFFFDIDNCLYPKSYAIHELMSVLIDRYFQSHLSISATEANELHARYYKDYGLAIEGLVRHHKVNPLEYNQQVDDALPLDDIIRPNPKLRQLLEDIDREKVRLWLFTNAYVTHGRRVVKLLGVEDLFEGMTFCDYGAERLLCKPAPEMFAKAMRDAGVQEPANCYFVGQFIPKRFCTGEDRAKPPQMTRR
nr:uncharacterized protein c24b11.05 [Quercus suber]